MCMTAFLKNIPSVTAITGQVYQLMMQAHGVLQTCFLYTCLCQQLGDLAAWAFHG
jgi:hypothetical protein